VTRLLLLVLIFLVAVAFLTNSTGINSKDTDYSSLRGTNPGNLKPRPADPLPLPPPARPRTAKEEEEEEEKNLVAEVIAEDHDHDAKGEREEWITKTGVGRVEDVRLKPPPRAAPTKDQMSMPLAPQSSAQSASTSTSTSVSTSIAKKKTVTVTALLYTMDSINTYADNASKGGPAGELTVRHSLEEALDSFGVQLTVATNDDEMLRLGEEKGYDIYIFDPWTWAGKGWKPRPFLVGKEKSTFILDFFGGGDSDVRSKGFNLSGTNFLTAFPVVKSNSFLGYFIDEDDWKQKNGVGKGGKKKESRGVIWGKKEEYYKGKETILSAISEKVELHSTCSNTALVPSAVFHGHLTPSEWDSLLSGSRFLLGLGDPLAGPSAVDAVAAGCMYINPTYKVPKKGVYMSQHPYLAESLPEYTCSCDLDNVEEVMGCVSRAMNSDLKPMIPQDFRREEYMKRAWTIFKEVVEEAKAAKEELAVASK